MTRSIDRDGTTLPPLPLGEWEGTKDTLHLYVQEIGKVQLATRAPQNHWWHVTLRLTPRGMSTGRLSYDGTHFDIEIDFIDHRVVIQDDAGQSKTIGLRNGLSVADFHVQLMGALERLGIRPEIKAEPFGVPTKTPFPEDREHASYQAQYVERFWRILVWTADILEEFAGWFCGKQSPVHVFWHSFDLAYARFSGRRAPARPGADPVTQEAYTHELISFGFWAGSGDVREPAFYSYTSPEPGSLADQPLQPDTAVWTQTGDAGHLAILRYEAVRSSEDPRSVLISFFQSAYEAGARTAGWPYDELESRWCPADVSAAHR